MEKKYYHTETKEIDDNSYQYDSDVNGVKKKEKKIGRKYYKSGFFAGVIWGIAIIFAVILVFDIVAVKITKNGINSSYIRKIGVDDKENLLGSYIDTYFYKEVDDEQLTEGAYKGIVSSLGDPYSVYYTKEEYAALNQSSEGEYTGIGVVVSKNPDTNEVVVLKVYTNSPAAEAGIMVGDVMSSVDGTDVNGMSTDKLAELVKGKEGTAVNIIVRRDGKEVSFDVIRKKVEVDMVAYEMLEDKIGYIIIDQFSGKAEQQVKTALIDLQSQGMEKLIIDLRDNPGGMLTSVKGILDYFLPEDKLVLYSMTKEGKKTEYFTQTKGEFLDIPICVLVNENSASASELFSGTMQCYDRGEVVGTVTFGKGIMQNIFPLDDGTAIKLTIGKYYLPDGSNIHEIGIKPDYEVEMTEGVKNIWSLEHKDAPQLCKAIEVLKSK